MSINGDNKPERTSYSGGIFEQMSDLYMMVALVRDSRGAVVDYRYREINPAFATAVARPADEIIGWTATELWGAKEHLLQLYDEVDRTGETIRSGGWQVWPIGAGCVAAICSELECGQEGGEQLTMTNSLPAAMVANIGDVIAIIGADGMAVYQSSNVEK